MMKRRKILALIGLASLMLVFLGCSHDADTEPWKKISNLNGLEGTWKGATNVRVLDMMYTMGFRPSNEDDVFVPDVTVKYTATVSYPFEIANSSVKGYSISLETDGTAVVEKMAENREITPDAMWNEIKGQVPEEQLNFSDGRPYTTTMKMELTEEDLHEGGYIVLFVNEDENRIKMEINAEDAERKKVKMVEIILEKQ